MKSPEEILEEFEKEFGLLPHPKDFKDCSCDGGDQSHHEEIISRVDTYEYTRDFLRTALGDVVEWAIKECRPPAPDTDDENGFYASGYSYATEWCRRNGEVLAEKIKKGEV